MNYRGFGGAWLALWLYACMAQAMADTLSLGELTLSTDPDWQRASAREERDADSLILRTEDASLPLEVFLPKGRSRLKVDEAKFYEQLEANWRSRYGEQVQVDWLVSGGVRWRLCRRPGMGTENLVFHAVTVHGGEAYHLVAVAPRGTELLPAPVRALLAGAAWRKPAPAAVLAAAKPPSVARDRWRLLRKVVAVPAGLEWAALAEAEGALLGGDGLVTGLGLSAKGAGLEGFVEGFLWKKGEGTGETRQAFRRDWRLQWSALPERVHGGEDLGLDLDFRPGSAGLDAPGDLMVRLELLPVCVPSKEMTRWLDDLARDGVASLQRLVGMACAADEGKPAPLTAVATAKEAGAGPGAGMTRRVSLPLPPAWKRGIRASTADDMRQLVLVARFMATEAGHAPGDALLRRAAAVFVFGPDV